MNIQYVIISILAMAIATFAVRFVPFVFCNQRSLPKVAKVWLSYIPITIFSVLLVSTLYEGAIELHFSKEIFWIFGCSAIAAALTYLTKSIAWGMMGALATLGVICFFH